MAPRCGDDRLSVAGVLFWYVPLVSHTGWHLYQRLVRGHGQYILTVESVFGEAAGPLAHRFDRFFIDIWGTSWIAWLVTSLALTGAALLVLRRQWRPLGWLATCFLPIMAFSVLFNSPAFAPYYAMPYVPLFAGLAAFGAIAAPSTLIRQRACLTTTISQVLVAVVVVALVHWTYPVVAMFHREVSPLVRALRQVRAMLDPDRDVVRYDPEFLPHVIYYLPDITMRRELPTVLNMIDPLASLSPSWNLTTSPLEGASVRRFHWNSARGAERLRPLSPHRYFDVYVTGPVRPQLAVFLSGWSSRAHNGERVMGHVSTTALLVTSDVMTLRLRLRAQKPVGHSTVVVRLDQAEIGRFTSNDHVMDRVFTVRPTPGRLWAVLTIEKEPASTLNHGGPEVREDDGLACEELTWSASQASNPSVVSEDQYLGPGWHEFQSDARNGWRWTEATGIIHLPPLSTTGELDVRLHVPPGHNGERSRVTLAIDGHVLDRFSAPAGLFSKTYRIPVSAQKNGPLDLSLSATPVFIPGNPQLRGILVAHVGWRPAAEP